MTLEHADPFLAWDVTSILFIFIAFFMVVIAFDKFILRNKLPLSENSGKKINNNKLYSLIYRFFFLRPPESSFSDCKILVRWAYDFIPVLLFVFLLRGFFIEPFRIPSNSMMPTLLTGDFILVSKFDYGISIPVINKQIIEFSEPKRGDVIVFRYPNYEKDTRYKGADFIKRIIGIPGDKIEYLQDKLVINDKSIPLTNISTYVGVESGEDTTGFQHSSEAVGEGGHDILLNPKRHSRGVNTVVPDGHYFVMGDNRSQSSDSRYWGFVPEEYIIGKAFGVWMHYDDTLKINRIGSIQ